MGGRDRFNHLITHRVSIISSLVKGMISKTLDRVMNVGCSDSDVKKRKGDCRVHARICESERDHER